MYICSRCFPSRSEAPVPLLSRRAISLSAAARGSRKRCRAPIWQCLVNCLAYGSSVFPHGEVGKAPCNYLTVDAGVWAPAVSSGWLRRTPGQVPGTCPGDRGAWASAAALVLWVPQLSHPLSRPRRPRQGPAPPALCGCGVRCGVVMSHRAPRSVLCSRQP